MGKRKMTERKEREIKGKEKGEEKGRNRWRERN